MYKIIEKNVLSEKVVKIVVLAELIASKAKAGQFVIIRATDNSERIPLTICNHNKDTITLIFQVVGASTMILNTLEKGDYICDVVGPLGKPTALENLQKVMVVAGGVGSAIAYPIAKSLKEKNAYVDTVLGFRNKELVILENEFNLYSDRLFITTDDGSYKRKGLVTDVIEELLKEEKYDMVFVIGPLVMMKFVSILTKKYHQKTTVSMNTIMIDGTGMCGGCRLIVDGKTKFACIDGPDFDAHLVDFDTAIKRSKIYDVEEKIKRETVCNLYKGIK